MGWDEGGVQKWGVVGPEVALLEKKLVKSCILVHFG